jgi:adenine-specific DNA glycosylase
MNAEKAHEWMVPLIPKGRSLSLHLNLIRLGREICRAKNPQCSICFLIRECLHPNFPPLDACLRGAASAKARGRVRSSPARGEEINFWRLLST